MATLRTDLPGPIGDKKLEKKPIKFSNLLLGAGLNLFEVTTLGQVGSTQYTVKRLFAYAPKAVGSSQDYNGRQ